MKKKQKTKQTLSIQRMILSIELFAKILYLVLKTFTISACELLNQIKKKIKNKKMKKMRNLKHSISVGSILFTFNNSHTLTKV